MSDGSRRNAHAGHLRPAEPPENPYGPRPTSTYGTPAASTDGALASRPRHLRFACLSAAHTGPADGTHGTPADNTYGSSRGHLRQEVREHLRMAGRGSLFGTRPSSGGSAPSDGQPRTVTLSAHAVAGSVPACLSGGIFGTPPGSPPASPFDGPSASRLGGPFGHPFDGGRRRRAGPTAGGRSARHPLRRVRARTVLRRARAAATSGVSGAATHVRWCPPPGRPLGPGHRQRPSHPTAARPAVRAGLARPAVGAGLARSAVRLRLAAPGQTPDGRNAAAFSEFTTDIACRSRPDQPGPAPGQPAARTTPRHQTQHTRTRTRADESAPRSGSGASRTCPGIAGGRSRGASTARRAAALEGTASRPRVAGRRLSRSGSVRGWWGVFLGTRPAAPR